MLCRLGFLPWHSLSLHRTAHSPPLLPAHLLLLGLDLQGQVAGFSAPMTRTAHHRPQHGAILTRRGTEGCQTALNSCYISIGQTVSPRAWFSSSAVLAPRVAAAGASASSGRATQPPADSAGCSIPCIHGQKARSGQSWAAYVDALKGVPDIPARPGPSTPGPG
jgi:hypothetical protein